MRFAAVLVCTLLLVGCTSSFTALRGSQDPAINELRVEVADLRHALHGAETEIKLLEERLERAQDSNEVAELKKKIVALEKSLDKLSSQTSATLTAYKQQIASIEGGFGEISKLRSTLLHLSKKSYQVKPGDSLGSIARKLQVSVEALKAENNLSSDKIVVGQELAVPSR